MENDLSTGQDVDWKAMARLPQFKGKLTLKGSKNYDFDFSRYIQDSNWSSSYFTALLLVKSFMMLLAPALLCHKEPARRIQSPLLGALERKILLGGYFACSSLVLYGIRELAPATP